MPCLRAARTALAVMALVIVAGAAAAQTGRIGGVVKDETGQPIKGATVLAQNENASPRSFTATTDDKGRFSIIGLRSGEWTFTAQAPGFTAEAGRMRVSTIGSPNPPLTFALKRAITPPVGPLGGIAAKDLQSELRAADQLYNTQQWDQAIAAYKAVLAKAPALSVINLQIASAYRNKKDFDSALASYNDLLKIDPNNDKARIGIGMTHLEKGDLKLADETLTTAAQAPAAGKEVFYNLGEVKFAKGEVDDAARWFQRASEYDPNWGKPLYKLGLIALNKGDKERATRIMERVISADPLSPEAVQAKTVIDQLK